MSTSEQEIEELIEEAQRQPGIADLMLAHREFEGTLKHVRECMAFSKPRESVTTSSNTS